MYVGLLKKIALLDILNTKDPNPRPAPEGAVQQIVHEANSVLVRVSSGVMGLGN